MEKKVFSVIMLIFLISSSSFFLVDAEEKAVLERLIEVDRYGFIYVVDTVPVEAGYVEVGFPRQLLPSLVDYYTPNGNIELKIEDQIFWLKITPTQAATSVRLTTIFGDMLKRSSAETFKVEFSLNPITRKNLEILDIKIILPERSNISKVSPKAIKVNENNIEASGRLSIDTTQIQNLELEFNIGEISIVKPLYTYLTLDLSSNEAEYNIKLSLIDGNTINSFSLNLPNGSSVLETRDQLRKLSSSYDEKKSILRVSFDRSLNVGESQTVIIRFKPPDGFFKLEGDRLSISPYLPFNLSTPDYRIRMILPSIEYVSSNIEPVQVKKIYPEKTYLTFYLGIVSPLTFEEKTLEVTVKQTPNIFSFIPIMLGVSSIIFFAGVLIYFLRPVFKPSIKEHEEKAFKLIGEVEELISSCNIVSELIASKKILDKGYVRERMLEVRNNIARNVGRIMSYSTDLRKTYPELEKSIESLTEFSRRVNESAEQLWTQTHRYLTGSIGKTLFTKQVDETYKNILKNLDILTKELEHLRKSLAR